MEFKNLVGEKFGRLTVTSLLQKSKHNRWLCHCVCGNVKEVSGDHLVSGGTTSCGCFRREQASINHTSHGHSCRSTLTYRIWKGMLRRVRGSDEHYGGRGIAVDSSWETFENFLNDMGEAPEGYSIEREDVNGNYCLANCTWIPRTQQNANKRNTVVMTLNGSPISVPKLSEILGIALPTLYYRAAKKGKTAYVTGEVHVRGRGVAT